MDDDQLMTSGRASKLAPRPRPLEQQVFEAAFRKTRTPMVFSDPNLPDCPIVEANEAFSELTGYASGEVLGRNCRFLQGPETDPDAVERIRVAVRERRSITEELYNYRSDGSGFWNALYISPVFNDDGELRYFFASQIDISEHREVVRRQTRRIESIGALASGVAHEFNNLMTVVLGSVELATARISDDSQRRHLERAGWGAHRAGKLATELLSLSRRQESHDQIVDLNQALRGIGHSLADITAPTATLDFDLLPGPLPVRLDPEQLERVVLDLVRNSVAAMPSGGRVSIRTCRLTGSEANTLASKQDVVELIVDDDGDGMPPQVAERAMELFFTTRTATDNIGLGLFLALDFADKIGGRLLIDTRPGHGTRIRMLLPYCRD